MLIHQGTYVSQVGRACGAGFSVGWLGGAQVLLGIHIMAWEVGGEKKVLVPRLSPGGTTPECSQPGVPWGVPNSSTWLWIW